MVIVQSVMSSCDIVTEKLVNIGIMEGDTNTSAAFDIPV